MMRDDGDNGRPAKAGDRNEQREPSRGPRVARVASVPEAVAPPPEPETVDIGKELALLAAPPVSVKGPRKEKPKTAKEAMRARVEAQRSHEQKRRETKSERSGPSSKRAKVDDEAAREVTGEERDSSPPSSSERVPKRPSLWQRFMGLFRSK